MGKLDQYCFDGTNALSLKKLPTDSKKDQVDKEKILAKTEKNQKKIRKKFLHFRISFTQMQKKD